MTSFVTVILLNYLSVNKKQRQQTVVPTVIELIELILEKNNKYKSVLSPHYQLPPLTLDTTGLNFC